LRAAAAAGHGARVRELVGGDLPVAVGEDVELILWAADYGAFQVLDTRLSEWAPGGADPVSEDAVRTALEIAREWTGVEAVAELRRRLGDADAVVQRDTVSLDYHGHADRVRVTAADGRWAEIQTTHLAILTYLEDRLGIDTSRAELMARALADRSSDSVNWGESWFLASRKPDVEATLHWAAEVLLSRDPGARRFAAEVVHALAIDSAPCRDEAPAMLRARLAVEADADVLVSLIGALAEYHGPGYLPEIASYAEHSDPRVRRQVAEELCFAVMDPGSLPAGVDSLAELGRDRDGSVRARALRVLRDFAFDHPVTRQLVADARDDADPRVRPEVLLALARGGDTTAYEELLRLGEKAGKGSGLAMLAYDAERWILNAEAMPPETPDSSPSH
jgi:hypothetical protein